MKPRWATILIISLVFKKTISETVYEWDEQPRIGNCAEVSAWLPVGWVAYEIKEKKEWLCYLITVRLRLPFGSYARAYTHIYSGRRSAHNTKCNRKKFHLRREEKKEIDWRDSIFDDRYVTWKPHCFRIIGKINFIVFKCRCSLKNT